MPVKPLSILLIDDDKDEFVIFDTALTKLDFAYSLLYYANGLSGIYEYIQQKQPAIIFLDINLPGKNGIYFLEEIKAKEPFKQIPVIIYSVSKNEHEVDLCYKKGAHYYLIKPYSVVNLAASLKRIFKTDWRKPQPQPRFEDFVINLIFA